MGFEPIRTERLILRPPRLSDADAAYERRSLPEVARYQDWEMPYTRERAEQSMARTAAMDGPVDDAGWTITVVDAAEPDQILGDLSVQLRWGGRTGYFGYTFHPDHWGRGYATEAARALVHFLFTDIGVSRIESSLHPDNPPSARVLEACGLIFEGLTRQSFWVGDECSDDMLYGMTRSDWEAWCNRPRQPPDQVELVPVTAGNRRAVGDLVIHKTQERFVSTMLGNFRDTLLPPLRDGVPVVPWFRAIEADGEIVGFIMAAEITEAHATPAFGASWSTGCSSGVASAPPRSTCSSTGARTTGRLRSRCRGPLAPVHRRRCTRPGAMNRPARSRTARSTPSSD